MDHHLTLIDEDPAGRPGIAILTLRGDVDAHDAAALGRLRRAASRSRQLHLEVGGVRFAGATFLGFLAGLAGWATSAGGSLHLHDVPDRLVVLLARAGMEGRFDMSRVHGVTDLRWRPTAPSPPEAAVP